MKFRALVLHLDDVPDNMRDVFDPEHLRLAVGPVSVYLDFNYDPSHRLGYAKYVKGEDGNIYADIEFNSAWAHPNLLKRLTPAVGGISKHRQYWYEDKDGNSIYSLIAYLSFLGLSTTKNCDHRIPTLGEQGFVGW